MKYDVQITYTAEVNYEVEAESRDSAFEKARDIFMGEHNKILPERIDILCPACGGTQDADEVCMTKGCQIYGGPAYA